MPSQDYPVGNGRLCIAIKHAIAKFIREFEMKPKRCFISTRPRHLPDRVDGVPVRSWRSVPKKTIRLQT